MGRKSNIAAAAEREWLDLRAASLYSGLSERTLRSWIHRGVDPLPAVRVGRKILISRQTFDNWLGAHPLITAGSIDVEAIAEQIVSGLGG